MVASAWMWVALSLAVGQGPEQQQGAPEPQGAPEQRGGPGRGRGHHGPPPPEAIDACEGKKAEESCGFTGPRGAVEGTCRAGPDSSKPLACAPAHPPGPPEHR